MTNFKLRIYSKILIVDILLIISMSCLIPLLSGYPPYSEDASFQVQIEGLTHSQQYVAFGVFGFILHAIFITFFFRKIFKFLKGRRQNKKFTNAEIARVRRDCFLINRKLCILQFFVLLIVLFVLMANIQISIVLCIKFLLIYFAFMMTAMIIYTLLIREEINYVIRMTYKEVRRNRYRLKKIKIL